MEAASTPPTPPSTPPPPVPQTPPATPPRPAARSSAEVKAEIEAQRDGLTGDIDVVRGETEQIVGKVKRALPFIAVAGIAAGAAYAYLKHRRSDDT